MSASLCRSGFARIEFDEPLPVDPFARSIEICCKLLGKGVDEFTVSAGKFLIHLFGSMSKRFNDILVETRIFGDKFPKGLSLFSNKAS